MIEPILQPVCVTDRYIDPCAESYILDKDRVPVIGVMHFTAAGLYRQAPLHGRNYALRDVSELFTSDELFDEYGNNYPALTIKGCETSGKVRHYPIEPSGVRVHGMLDASTFERCKRASAILREAGVLTEWPFIMHGHRGFLFQGLLHLRVSSGCNN